MKYCIIIPDGAADFPLNELNGSTPLQAADNPNMNRAAREGLLGVTATVPDRMEAGSDVAIMNLFGYDPRKFYTGRAPLEAADLGIVLEKNQLAFRCNMVTIQDNCLKDFSAGHISTAEAEELIAALNDEFEMEDCHFYTGTGYRNLMLFNYPGHLDVFTNAPHQVMGQPLAEIRPAGEGAQELRRIMERSRGVLETHRVNRGRAERGLPVANMTWLWGQGRKPALETFKSRFAIQGAAISAVNLVRGIAKIIGWDVVDVPNITGYLDTDYRAKGKYAVDALQRYDLVTVHIEAPDEASHEGNAAAKVEAIERIDRDIVGPVMDFADSAGGLRLLLLPDHITSVESRRHMKGAVPLAVWGHGIKAASGLSFSEKKARETDIVWDDGFELMPFFLRR